VLFAGPSHDSHTLLLDLAFSTNAPVGQTVPRLAVWTVGAVGGDSLSATRSLLRLIHGYLLLKIWLNSRLSHVYGIYVIVNELRFPGCFDLIFVRMD